MIEQRGLPSGLSQDSQGAGWFDWVTKALNSFLRGRGYRVVKVTADYAMKEVDSIILVDATTGNVTITPLSASNAQDKRLTVKKLDSSGHTVTVTGTFDGGTVVIGTQYESKEMVPDPDSNVWWLI